MGLSKGSPRGHGQGPVLWNLRSGVILWSETRGCGSQEENKVGVGR